MGYHIVSSTCSTALASHSRTRHSNWASHVRKWSAKRWLCFTFWNVKIWGFRDYCGCYADLASLTSAMQSIINDSKATAARTRTCFPMGSTCNMSTMTRLNLMHGQDDTVVVPRGGGQRATCQVTMHIPMAAPAPSWLLYSKAVLESKKAPYVIMLWNLVSLHICKIRLNFHCKDNLSSDTLQFLNTW